MSGYCVSSNFSRSLRSSSCFISVFIKMRLLKIGRRSFFSVFSPTNVKALPASSLRIALREGEREGGGGGDREGEVKKAKEREREREREGESKWGSGWDEAREGRQHVVAPTPAPVRACKRERERQCVCVFV